jgi:hypothetical protein
MTGNTGNTGNPPGDQSLDQIEYLLYQSTQGIHFMFENSEIVKVLGRPQEEGGELSFSKIEQVQSLLTKFIEKPSINEKRRFLETLDKETYETLIRAYFQLVENTILANSNIRH